MTCGWKVMCVFPVLSIAIDDALWALCETVCGFARRGGRRSVPSTAPAASTRRGQALNERDASRVDSETMAVPKLTTISEGNNGMQIKTILNRIQKHRGFVYGAVLLEEQIELHTGSSVPPPPQRPPHV